MPFEDTTILKYLSTALDIAVVWFIIYKLILIIRGTKAVQLFKRDYSYYCRSDDQYFPWIANAILAN